MFLPRAFFAIRLVGYFILTLIGVVLFYLGLALSPWGTHWLLNQARSHGFIEYNHVSGSPLDQLSLDDVRLNAGGTQVSAQQLSLHWDTGCFWHARLCLDDVSGQGIHVLLPASQSSSNSSSSLSHIQTPIPMEIRHLQANDITVQMATGMSIKWNQFSSGLSFTGDQVRLFPTRMDGLTVNIPAASTAANVSTENNQTTGQSPVSSGVGQGTEVLKTASRTLTPAQTDSEKPTSDKTSETALMDAGLRQNGASADTSIPNANTGKGFPTDKGTTISSAPALSPSTGITLRNPLAAYSTTKLTSEKQPITLPDIQLPVNVSIPSIELTHTRLTGAYPLTFDHIHMAMEASGSHVALADLSVDGPQLNARLTADLQLEDHYPIKLAMYTQAQSSLINALMPTMTSSVPDKAVNGEQLHLGIQGDLANLGVELNANGPEVAHLKANANLLSQQVPFTLEIQVPHVEWPLPGMPEKLADGSAVSHYRLDDFSLNGSGSLTGYQVALKGHASGSQIKPLDIQLNGSGDDKQFTLTRARVNSPQGGTVNASGKISFGSGIAVTSQLALEHVHPQAFAPRVEGDLNGQAQAMFKRDSLGHWLLQIPALNIQGSLMRQPLSLVAKLNANDAMKIDVDQLDIRQGSNTVSGRGHIDQAIDMALQIHAPALQTLLPGLLPTLRGHLSGNIHVGGTTKNPQGNVDLEGGALRYGQYQLGGLHLKGLVNGVTDPAMKLTLTASNVVAASQQLRAVEVGLDGRLSAHVLNVAVDGQKGILQRGKLSLRGGYDKAHQKYQGQLSALTLAMSQGVGHVALDHPVSLAADIAHSRFNVASFCLNRAEGGNVCVTRRIDASAQQGQAALALNNVPINVVNAFLPSPWSVQGSGHGVINADWSQAGKIFHANGTLQAAANVTGKAANGQPYKLPPATLHIGFNASNAQARLQLTSVLDNAGQVVLDARVANPMRDRRLSGQLQLNHLILSPYQPLVAQLNKLKGELNGNISLAGSLQQPLLNGHLGLTNIQAAGPQLPVGVDDAQVNLALHGNNGQLTGYLNSGEAHWGLSGSAHWPTLSDWHAALSLDGANSPLQAQALDYGHIEIAPQIHVDASPQKLSIQGDVHIPSADIQVNQLPVTAVSPSPDQVILTKEQAAELDRIRSHQHVAGDIPTAQQSAEMAALQKAGMALDLNVHLILGSKVRLRAYGLDTHLNGALNVLENDQTANTLELFGNINLKDGHYSSFGQNLIINRGQITFNGPPTVPNLNFEAIRNPDTIENNVTAGIRVTGSATAPRLKVFSDPAMDETTALSYLLSGHAPESDGNNNALTSALIGLSISQSGRAMGAIGQAFGIQDLSLDTTGTGDSSQVVVSGYIGPNLKIGYGVGVFSSIAELTLRYRLLHNLYVQVVSGSNQALNLLYSFSLGRTADIPQH
ncbi:hypothetical protein LMG33818_000135 [Halomonadaceae bacterium LMG 33818]|uniref:autotransporter assembly complex protein TamB n=1 Tax=Cernens ardua TaxID=3402176 RepID=UPI003EDC261D